MVDWAQTPKPKPQGIEDAVDRLSAAVEKCQEKLDERRVHIPSDPIPLSVRQRPLHPDNAADTDWAIILRHEFEIGGYAGLARALKVQARTHQNDKRVHSAGNYKVLLDDNNLLDFMVILASMYPKFITSLISGDVFYQRAADGEMRKALSLEHELDKIPGNYLQGFVQLDTVRIAPEPSSGATVLTQAPERASNEHSGKGLTFNELYEVIEYADLYMPSNPNKSIQDIFEIDRLFQPVPVAGKDVDYTIGKHRYVQAAHGKSRGNEDKNKVWLAELKKVYYDRIRAIKAKNPNDPILEQPMRVSLLEIGWGQDAQARASAHDDHKSSNRLFTFFQALVTYVRRNEPGYAKFKIQRLMTNALNRGNKLADAALDAELADVGITMVGRTESFHGNLNPNPGGGAGIQGERLESRLEFIRNQGRKVYQETGSRFQLSVKEDNRKIGRLEAFDKITDQEIEQREKRNAEKFDDLHKRFAVVQSKMENLQRVKLKHMLNETVQAAEADDGNDKADRPDAINMAISAETKMRAPIVSRPQVPDSFQDDIQYYRRRGGVAKFADDADDDADVPVVGIEDDANEPTEDQMDVE